MKWIFLIPVWIKDGSMFTQLGKSFGGSSAIVLCPPSPPRPEFAIELDTFLAQGRVSIANTIYVAIICNEFGFYPNVQR